jgi:hypothetical protein
MFSLLILMGAAKIVKAVDSKRGLVLPAPNLGAMPLSSPEKAKCRRK